jgi:tripartite-type tricarboxylate transporter receptor subunit TctC
MAGSVSRLIAAVAVCLFACAAWAQSYPSKPIRTIIALGGGAEVLARLVGQKAGDALGQPIIVEAQSAAGGSIGAQAVARAAPDGYTILFAATNSQVWHVFLARSTPYDPVKDFTPITKIGEALLCVVANNDFPVNSMKELVEYARRNPGKVSYGTSGIGTTHHLSGELIKQVTGIDMVHVPYKGGAQVLTDTVGGRIPVAFSIVATADSLLKSGKLKLLAVNNAKRSPLLSHVPTISEEIPGYESPPGWMGYFGPAGLPQPVLKRLHAELTKALNSPEVRSKSEDMGFVIGTSAPEEFAAQIKRDLELAGKIVKGSGIQPE